VISQQQLLLAFRANKNAHLATDETNTQEVI